VLSCSDDKVRQAITLGLATLVGGAAGSLLGTDATSAALGAQNEEGGLPSFIYSTMVADLIFLFDKILFIKKDIKNCFCVRRIVPKLASRVAPALKRRAR
jgi:hypothetical protein